MFELSSLDLVVQDSLYRTDTGWLIDRHSPLPRFVFYDGPKAVLFVWVGVLVVSLAWPRWFPTLTPADRRRSLYLLACIAAIPGFVSVLKRATTVYYPYKVQRYGGKRPYRKLYQSLRRRPGEPSSRGFPAGHASGGFALLGLYFAARTRRGKLCGALIGLGTGWTLGLYQMLKGAHYLSHTVVSMILAWMIAALLAWIFRLPEKPLPVPPAELPEDSASRESAAQQAGGPEDV